jgi:hypothetical protein
MSEINEMRKVFEDRQKDIYQGSEELSSCPDGKYLSHYVRCDFDWFQAAWGHQESRIKELESRLEQAKKDQARDQYVRTLTCDEFSDLLVFFDDLDIQIDIDIASIYGRR